MNPLFDGRVPIAALVISMSIAATAGADFIEEARALERMLGCQHVSPKSAITTATDVESLPALGSQAVREVLAKLDDPVRDYCQAVAPTFEWYRAVYLRVAAPFLGGLRPPDSPEKAIHLYGGGDLLSALTAYGDVHEITTLSASRAGDPRKTRDLLPLMARFVPELPIWSEKRDEAIAAVPADVPFELAFYIVALAMHGFEPRALRYFKIDDEGEIHYLEANELKKPSDFASSELVYAYPGSKDLRVHRHISTPLTDYELKRNPKILRHLEKKGPVLALSKGSSYYLWLDTHTQIRDYLLEKMVLMISDSTGFPPSIASRAGFTQSTFGHFQGTIFPVSHQYESEMKRLWSDPSTRPVPFRFGYLDIDKHHHLLITQRGTPDPEKADKLADERIDHEDELEGGRHLRLWTKRGAVHVWQPNNYRADSAGTVIYLHGYYTNTDGAWLEHQLAAQFAAAKKNALYLVPEASAGDYEEPFWDSANQLLELTQKLTRTKTPKGPLIVLAHSGGFRTAARWAKATSDHLRQIHLLDGLYSSQIPTFKTWLKNPPAPAAHQLILTSTETAARSDMLAEEFPDCTRRETIPENAAGFSDQEKSATLIYMRSQYEHMELVTGGKVIPFLLELTPLETIK